MAKTRHAAYRSANSGYLTECFVVQPLTWLSKGVDQLVQADHSLTEMEIGGIETLAHGKLGASVNERKVACCASPGPPGFIELRSRMLLPFAYAYGLFSRQLNSLRYTGVPAPTFLYRGSRGLDDRETNKNRDGAHARLSRGVHYEN